MTALLLAIALLCTPALASGDPATEGSAAYRVDARDVLDVQVYGEQEASGEVVVAEGGVIDLPLAGEVSVAGLTPLEVARKVESVLGASYYVDPHVTVRIVQYGSREVQVLGAVKQPGVYYLNGPTSLIDMLAQAGGISKESIKEVQVRREGQEPILVQLDQLVSSGAGDLFLQKADVVYVPEGRVVWVGGEVSRPGEVAFLEGLTLTQAITMAGSWKPTALKSTVYVLRDGERMQVNVRRILKAKEADILLQPGDQVEVPESPI